MFDYIHKSDVIKTQTVTVPRMRWTAVPTSWQSPRGWAKP